MKTPDYVAKRFKPMKTKGLRKELSRTIRNHFPRVGGVRMADLCADIVLELVDRHLHPRDHLQHAQLLWLGFDIDDPPSRNKRSEDVRLIPVVLDLCTEDDLDAVLDRVPPRERLLHRCIRLLEQAFDQGAVLSNVDLACILSVHESAIGSLLAAHEKNNSVVLPRRATLHDVGSGVTHKRIICWKRFVDGKSPEIIARETHHSLTAVDRYLGMFERVRFCIQQDLRSDEIARALGCTQRLVKEYAAINDLITSEAVS